MLNNLLDHCKLNSLDCMYNKDYLFHSSHFYIMYKIRLNLLQNNRHLKYIDLKIRMNIFLQLGYNQYMPILFHFLLNNILNIAHILRLLEDIVYITLCKMYTHPHMSCMYFKLYNDNLVNMFNNVVRQKSKKVDSIVNMMSLLILS